MKIPKFAHFLIFFSLLLTCDFAWCADGLPSVESFFKNPVTTLAVISPLGNYVAYVSTSDDGVQTLAVRETADLNKGNAVTTSDTGDRILTLYWVNENRLVFEIKRYSTEFLGGIDTVAVNRDGSNLALLISANYGHTQQSTGSNITSRILTADYGFFRTTHNGGDDIIVEKINYANAVREVDGTRLFRLNTKTQRLTELLDTTQPHNVLGWVIDPDDIPRIAFSRKQGVCTVSYLVPDSNTWSELATGDCLDGHVFSPFFFESADSLFAIKSYNGFDSLYRYDLRKKELAKEPLLNLPGMDFIGGLITDYVAKKVIGINYDGDAKATYWIDQKYKGIQQKIDKALNTTNNFISCGTDCLNAPAVLIKSVSDRQPTEYFIYNIAQDKLTAIGAQNPKIKPTQMGMRDFAHFTARDGLNIPVYITLPPGKAIGPMAAIVLVHGGPWVRGSSWEWESEAQFLASRGYVVIQPEFRGSRGFGQAFFKAGWKQWGLTMQDDLADAALWAEKKGWADPKRIGIMGASYGGYATLMGLIKNPEIFRCGVEWSGVTDLTLRYNTPQDDASLEVLSYDLKTMVGDPVADAEMFKQNSPLQNTGKLTQPLLIAHGGMDRRVPIVHASDLYRAIESHNKNVEWIVYNDEAHGWYHENNRIDFWNHVEVFLDKNLKSIN